MASTIRQINELLTRDDLTIEQRIELIKIKSRLDARRLKLLGPTKKKRQLQRNHSRTAGDGRYTSPGVANTVDNVDPSLKKFLGEDDGPDKFLAEHEVELA